MSRKRKSQNWTRTKFTLKREREKKKISLVRRHTLGTSKAERSDEKKLRSAETSTIRRQKLDLETPNKREETAEMSMSLRPRKIGSAEQKHHSRRISTNGDFQRKIQDPSVMNTPRTPVTRSQRKSSPLEVGITESRKIRQLIVELDSLTKRETETIIEAAKKISATERYWKPKTKKRFQQKHKIPMGQISRIAANLRRAEMREMKEKGLIKDDREYLELYLPKGRKRTGSEKREVTECAMRKIFKTEKYWSSQRLRDFVRKHPILRLSELCNSLQAMRKEEIEKMKDEGLIRNEAEYKSRFNQPQQAQEQDDRLCEAETSPESSSNSSEHDASCSRSPPSTRRSPASYFHHDVGTPMEYAHFQRCQQSASPIDDQGPSTSAHIAPSTSSSSLERNSEVRSSASSQRKLPPDSFEFLLEKQYPIPNDLKTADGGEGLLEELFSECRAFSKRVVKKIQQSLNMNTTEIKQWFDRRVEMDNNPFMRMEKAWLHYKEELNTNETLLKKISEWAGYEFPTAKMFVDTLRDGLPFIEVQGHLVPYYALTACFDAIQINFPKDMCYPNEAEKRLERAFQLHADWDQTVVEELFETTQLGEKQVSRWKERRRELSPPKQNPSPVEKFKKVLIYWCGLIPENCKEWIARYVGVTVETLNQYIELNQHDDTLPDNLDDLRPVFPNDMRFENGQEFELEHFYMRNSKLELTDEILDDLGRATELDTETIRNWWGKRIEMDREEGLTSDDVYRKPYMMKLYLLFQHFDGILPKGATLEKCCDWATVTPSFARIYFEQRLEMRKEARMASEWNDSGRSTSNHKNLERSPEYSQVLELSSDARRDKEIRENYEELEEDDVEKRWNRFDVDPYFQPIPDEMAERIVFMPILNPSPMYDAEPVCSPTPPIDSEEIEEDVRDVERVVPRDKNISHPNDPGTEEFVETEEVEVETVESEAVEHFEENQEVADFREDSRNGYFQPIEEDFLNRRRQLEKVLGGREPKMLEDLTGRVGLPDGLHVDCRHWTKEDVYRWAVTVLPHPQNSDDLAIIQRCVDGKMLFEWAFTGLRDLQERFGISPRTFYRLKFSAQAVVNQYKELVDLQYLRT